MNELKTIEIVGSILLIICAVVFMTDDDHTGYPEVIDSLKPYALIGIIIGVSIIVYKL